MSPHKIFPSLWFCTDGGGIAEVVQYYKNIFGPDLEAGGRVPLGETPSGHTEMCEVSIFGQKFSWMSTAREHHPFNDAISFTLRCADQQEIDTYWDYFTREGKESQCGWCTDKYGLRWQVIPENLGELMASPHAWEVMMSQKKIVIAEYAK
jgi:predicted 3-demethylubiquinone-9 3-methyltransferase (glyoxalase superfamily)